MRGGWYIHLEGKPQGTFTDDQIQTFCREGTLGIGSLIWKKGLAAWEPIELHFQSSLKSQVENPIQPERTPEISHAKPVYASIPLPATSPTLPVSAEPRSGLIVLIGACLSLTIPFPWVLSSASGTVDASSLMLWWWSSLVASAIASVFMLRRLWQFAERSLSIPQHQGRGGFLKLICFLGSLSLIGYIAIVTYGGIRTQKIAKARSAYNKYSIDVDIAANIISISGIIGPNLAAVLKDHLTIHSDIHTIVINSPGGLVDEALAAARFIQTLPNAVVVAHDTCNSACLIILMSGASRVADWNMKLGFHASAPITTLDEVAVQAGSTLGDESYSYLIQRGVPPTIVNKAKVNGPSQLELVPAIDLVDYGALTGLVDQSNLIDSKIAKWRYVESYLASPTGPDLGALLLAIRESDPNMVQVNAESLYQAVTLKDPPRLTKGIAAVTSGMIQRAMKCGDGDALNEYVAITFLQIRHLAKLEEWQACATYGEGNMQDYLAVMSQDLRRREFEALGKLIRSAAINKWRIQPIPSWVKKSGPTLVQELAKEAVELGLLDKNGNPVNQRANCLWMYNLFDKILNKEGDTAAPMLRWLLVL